MADGHHFENLFRYTSATNHPITMKFDMQTSILISSMVTRKTEILQIQDVGLIPSLKAFISYSSAIHCPINTNFGGRKQNHMQTQVTCPKYFENSRWRTAAILKIVVSVYLRHESSDLDEIWCADANFDSKGSHMTKIIFLPIQYHGPMPS